MKSVPEVPREQIVYANILYYGSLIGMAFLTLTFALYILGIFPSFIDLADLPELWTHDTHHLVKSTDLPIGWGWVALLNYGDILNLLALAFLAFLTILCYLAIIPMLVKKRDWVYVMIALAEVVILLLAASGILQAGH